MNSGEQTFPGLVFGGNYRDVSSATVERGYGLGRERNSELTRRNDVSHSHHPCFTQGIGVPDAIRSGVLAARRAVEQLRRRN